METTHSKKKKLIYIAGLRRSGSTLLSTILSEAHNSLSIGEPSNVWTTKLGSDMCSCKKELKACPLWGTLLIQYFQVDNWTEIPSDGLNRLWLTSQGINILLGRTSFITQNHISLLKKLYFAIYDITKVDVLIDESKYLPYLYALVKTESFNIFVVHIVRDPRAVAFSWQRNKNHRRGTMNVYPWHVTARNWLSQEFLFLISKCFVADKNRITIRYEDMIENPQKVIKEIFIKANLKGEIPFTTNENFYIKNRNHILISNPSAPEIGLNTVYKDFEWKEKMPRWAKMLVTLICWPMMLVHNYPIFSDYA